MAEDIFVLIRENDLPELYRLSYKGVKAYLNRQKFKGKDGASVVWQGAWSSSTSYSPLDMVSYNGQSYISIKLGTNKNPETRTDYWDIMAVKGTSGEGIIWQGAWDSGTTYEINDAVSNDGSSYVCILESTDNEPPNATYWGVLAQAGTSTMDIHGLTEKTSLADNDEVPISDSADSYNNKKSLWSTFKSTLKTYFDTLYAVTAHNHDSSYVAKNSAISGATKTKITYDAKGLVTAGDNATQDDIGDGSTYKQYSASDKSKLAGIEASADVTDLTNVSSAINGASAATPVDADKFSFVDADDNTIKTVTGANLKTYIGAGSGDVTKDELASGSLVTTIADTEHIPISVAGSPNSIKKIVWTAFKTILDGIYALAGHSHNYLVPTGGTTDQVLAKNSNTNGDLKWATVSGGSFDIHALTATTALANADEFPLYDDSASANRKSTWETIWKHLFPVGSIVCFDNTTSDPNTIYGGTWSRVGDGKFPVGYNSADTDFDTALETGGSKTNDISHTHPISPTTKVYTAGALAVQSSPVATNTGGSTTLKILPPYIVYCYWRRTA